MRKKNIKQLVEENIKSILKDQDKVSKIYDKIDQTIITETKKVK